VNPGRRGGDNGDVRQARASLSGPLAAIARPVPPARHLLSAKDLADSRYAEPLRVDDLARAARLSRSQFSSEFRRAFGESPHAYLTSRRLERASALLRTTDRSVADICMSVGLSSVGSFTTRFTQTFGLSPTAYRASYPPAVALAIVPWCVVRVYGRPQLRTIREDAPPGLPQDGPDTNDAVGRTT
jgi:AraC-like DNA-binding protein